MTVTQHTPGPWKVHPYIAMTGPNAGRDIGPHQLAVARAIGEFETDAPTAQTEANANLLAAAPDLLKLLREVLEWNEDDADLATHDTAFRLKNFADTVKNRSAALCAAIAKATGAA